MPDIRLLPDGLKNKIAAGEVVERPASVVKELVENSLDADSDLIRIEVLQGGRKLVRVSDNGFGMDRQDALACLQRHATSKLSSEDDLMSLRTLGFRGEALPAIASVSRLTLITSKRGSGTGIRLEVEGGEVLSVKDSPADGTDVAARDLFYNTPARRKFLKKESTEMLHIVDAVTREALCHPAVGFSLVADGQGTISLPRASGPRERLIQVYGLEFVDELVEVSSEAGGMGLTAFVSAPSGLRQTKANQMVFLNRRPVREPSISHAVYSAYGGQAPEGRHPVFFLFLDLDPSVVDFNVHPTKREVRFEDKDSVYRFVRRSVSVALAGRTKESAPYVSSAGRAGEAADSGPEAGGDMRVSEPLSLDYRAEIPHLYIGDAFVVLAEGDGLTIMDHHAAHERVLYERLLDGMSPGGRRLLFPRQVVLSPREHMLILKHRDTLSELGLDVEDFGPDTVAVRSVPDGMDEPDLRGLLSDAAEEMEAGLKPGRSLKEALAARMACHSSVRGRKILDGQAIMSLIGDLDRTSDPGHCPHGRPTRVRYTVDELRKAFKRK